MSEDLTGPAPRSELEAVRWAEQVIAARDAGIGRYTPAALVPAISAEQDETFEVPVPIGRLRRLVAHIHRLRARELTR
jgi:hypothetical protein